MFSLSFSPTFDTNSTHQIPLIVLPPPLSLHPISLHFPSLSLITLHTAVTTMGSQEFYKWPVVNGNNETWLEYSYYSFELGQNAGFPNMTYRCAGHGSDDKALPGNLTYTSTYAQ